MPLTETCTQHLTELIDMGGRDSPVQEEKEGGETTKCVLSTDGRRAGCLDGRVRSLPLRCRRRLPVDAGADRVDPGTPSLAHMMRNTVKSGVAQFCSSVYFSMEARAFLQEAPCAGQDGRTAVNIIVALSQRHGQSVRPASLPPSPGATLVGGTLTPRPVRAGRLRIRLVSKDIVADTIQGEDPTLTKIEPDFKGRSFEKQFACKYKLGPVKEGVFGKVIVERLADSGIVEPVLEFNLAKGDSVQRPVCKPEMREQAKRPIHEQAVRLSMTDPEKCRALASYLGLDDVREATSGSDAFSAVATSYRARGGTDDELLQAMCDVSRNVGGATSSNRKSLKRKRTFSFPPTQSSPECVRHVTVAPRASLSVSETTISFEDSDSEDDEVRTRLSPNTTHFPTGVFPLTSSPFTVTPPTTPVKRTSSVCEADSPSSRSPDAKRIRMSFSFGFDDDDEEIVESRPARSDSPNSTVLTTGVTKPLQFDWKRLGRSLAVQDGSLRNVDDA